MDPSSQPTLPVAACLQALDPALPSHSCSGLASDPVKIRTLSRPHTTLREGGRLSVRIKTGCPLKSEPQINTKYPFTLCSMPRQISQFNMTLFSHFVVQWLSHVQLFVTPWTAARQASLCFTVSQSLLKLMSIKYDMSDAIQPSHPPSSPSPPALSLSQHQGLFQ